MSPLRAKRSTVFSLATVLLATALTGAAITTAAADEAVAAADCGALFDDFAYTSSSDPALAAHGWVPRSYPGGPGVPGATWSPSSITFPSSGIMQLTASTDGTGAGTRQAELYTSRKRYLEGTYASRIRFSDAPTGGADGDHIVQTFFSISPLNGDLDPTYSELDFTEYLPNGGWGEQGPINYQTSWYTYRADPWFADNVHSSQRQSFNGWHDLVAQVSGGHVKYYIDGVLLGDHSGKYFPRQTMTINFNLWFIDTAGHTGSLSTYVEQVDWVLYTDNDVLSPSQATARAAAYRQAGTSFVDTVDAGGPCTGPSPTPTATTSPTPSPTGQPTDCDDAPQWTFGGVYQGASLVVHERSANGNPSGPPSGDGAHLWRARWWTQGSEPGWTGVWEDLGRC
ncbi:glycosyl hydrolase [Phytomonospora sp. NPDC050363]|uniref:glycosyl hydrolase n=1 Tax=Phytomonospora sp. NPDC050363 TaxID=3155642 RepID=UPI0033DE8900